MRERGRFIVLEGGEGAGKSTQAARLAKRLKALGLTALLTREPGGSEGAEAIRRLLVSGQADRWDPLTETLLHFAARADHLGKTVRPALQRGQWVVSDRFADSTMAYQGYGLGVDRRLIEILTRAVVGPLKPDLTILLDLPIKIGLKRAKGRGASRGDDRYERMTRAFHRRLRRGYLEIARRQRARYVVIDAARPPDMVAADIWTAVRERLKLKGRRKS
jgi:dTMP kinase